MNIYIDVVSYIKNTKKEIVLEIEGFHIHVNKKKALKFVDRYKEYLVGYDDSFLDVFFIEIKRK